MKINDILCREELGKNDIVRILSADDEEIKIIKRKAFETLEKYCGTEVNLRGLIEFSNICINNCYYCGIRRDSREVSRYTLTKEEILDTAVWCAENRYGSIALQSGDRKDAVFVDFVEDVLYTIKEKTKSDRLPDGLGITLSIGEQDYKSYERFFKAGAHRYLLRIETSYDELFRSIHPEAQSLARRIECLSALRDIGYQVGTGVMIGIPGQTIEQLADDVLFFQKNDFDMFGMGPYIVHKNTPMKGYMEEISAKSGYIFKLALKMIAAVRLVMKDVNIASTTALQAMDPRGREEGLGYGANVIMPLLTPEKIRKEYLLYEGKPGVDDLVSVTDQKVKAQIEEIGRKINYDNWGDSKHFAGRQRRITSR